MFVTFHAMSEKHCLKIYLPCLPVLCLCLVTYKDYRLLSLLCIVCNADLIFKLIWRKQCNIYLKRKWCDLQYNLSKVLAF
jgi:hypothetical protein